jgi:trk system potassium uptake protein TrkA
MEEETGMNLIILGAGPVGSRLVERALAGGHDVVLVEPDETLAEDAAREYDVRVLAMGVGDDRFPEESQLDDAEALIATTADDSVNIMAMLLGQEAGVATLTSTVNQPGHVNLSLLPEASDVTTLRDGQQIIELQLDAASPLTGRTAEQIHADGVLDETLEIIARVREGETQLLKPDEPLAAGDGLVLFATQRLRGRRRRLFRESTGEG